MSIWTSALNAILRLQRTNPHWNFWLRWMLGTICGVPLVLIVSVLLSAVMMALPGTTDSRSLDSFAPNALMTFWWSVLGACLGLGQWWALRRELEGSGWWILATLAGYPLGATLQFALPRVDNPALEGLIMMFSFGAALGVLQSLVLRGRIQRAVWWVPISLAGWLMAFAATGVAYLTNSYVEPFDMLAAFLFPIAIGGAGMVWLLQNKVPARIAEFPKYRGTT